MNKKAQTVGRFAHGDGYRAVLPELDEVFLVEFSVLCSLNPDAVELAETRLMPLVPMLLGSLKNLMSKSCQSEELVELMTSIRLLHSALHIGLEAVLYEYTDKLREREAFVTGYEVDFNLLDLQEDFYAWEQDAAHAYAFARAFELLAGRNTYTKFAESPRRWVPLYYHLSAFDVFIRAALHTYHREEVVSLAKVVRHACAHVGLTYKSVEYMAKNATENNAPRKGVPTNMVTELVTLDESERAGYTLTLNMISGLADALLLPAGFILWAAERDTLIQVVEHAGSGTAEKNAKSPSLAHALQDARVNSKLGSQISVSERLQSQFELRVARIMNAVYDNGTQKKRSETIKNLVEAYYKQTTASSSMMGQIETGRRIPSPVLIETLAELYKIDAGQLHRLNYSVVMKRCDALQAEGTDLTLLLNLVCDEVEKGASPETLLESLKRALRTN